MRRPILAILVALPMSGTLLCVTAPAQAADSSRPAKTQVLEFPVRLISAGASLTELPGGVTYGWNDLRGPTRWGTRTAELRFQGSVDYVDGTGPFGGFVTITRVDGTQLALSVTGNATTPAKGGPDRTAFLGSVTVIGGSGPFAHARGVGRVTGFRKAALRSPVSMTFTVKLQQKKRG